jgi:hypothetical protein
MYAASFRKTEVTYVTLLFSAFILKCTKEERSRKKNRSGEWTNSWLSIRFLNHPFGKSLIKTFL